MTVAMVVVVAEAVAVAVAAEVEMVATSVITGVTIDAMARKFT